MFRPLVVLLVVAMLGACGGSSSSSDNQTSQTAAPTIAAFSSDSSSLPYGGGNVSLQWSVSGATRVSIDHGLGDVTDKSSAQTSVTESTTFTLTATNAGGTVTQSVSVIVAQPATVSGVVLDSTGLPVASATVVIGTRPATVTDASGHFSVSGVAQPFDVAVVGPSAERIVIYKGLTATQLKLTLLGGSPEVSRANIYGWVSGGSTPYSSSNAPVVIFASPESSTRVEGTTSDGIFSLGVSWPTSGSTTGTLVALQPSLDGSGNPTGWLGYGRKDGVTLNAGSNVSGVSLTMSTVSTSTLAGQVSVPAGYVMDGEEAILELDPVGDVALMSNTSGSNAFGFNVPMIPQSSYAIAAAVHPQNRVNGASSVIVSPRINPGNNAVNLAALPVPNLGTPIDAANAVDSSTSFAWTQTTAQAVYDLRAVRSDGVADLQIDIITSSTTAHLPDLSALGVSIPSATPFDWEVFGLSPFQTIDEVGTTEEMQSLFGYRREGSVARSDYRTFTTR